ncbi:MAG: hypothetical protein KC425_08455, partial [Anaerolineales bacterium]|nr:hypothetical protein [Anaerolineales bacterium]
MNEQRFETGETPHVMLKTSQQDVTISSWIRPAVTVGGTAFTAESPEADLVVVSGDAPLTIQLPRHSRLTIDSVAGSLTIKHVAGLIKIGQVQGRLQLKQVGGTQVDVVEGELQAENLDGPFRAGEVAQHATIRNATDVQIDRAHTAVSLRYVNGRVTLGEVGGDLEAHTIGGSLQMQRSSGGARLGNLGGQLNLPAATGDVWLVGGLAPGEHTITTQNSIFVYWPSQAPLNLVATGGDVFSTLPLRQAADTVEDDQMTLTGYIKDRKTFLILKTPGRIGLTTWDDSGAPAFAPADFERPPAPVAPPAAPAAPAAPDAAPAQQPAAALETAVSRAVAAVLSRLTLELGAEWGRRCAAVELEDRLAAAITRELSSLAPAPAQAAVDASPAPSPGTAAFTQAETAVRRLLQKIEDSIDRARQKLAATPNNEDGAV